MGTAQELLSTVEFYMELSKSYELVVQRIFCYCCLRKYLKHWPSSKLLQGSLDLEFCKLIWFIQFLVQSFFNWKPYYVIYLRMVKLRLRKLFSTRFHNLNIWIQLHNLDLEFCSFFIVKVNVFVECHTWTVAYLRVWMNRDISITVFHIILMYNSFNVNLFIFVIKSFI